MKLELEQQLVSKYPNLFKQYGGDPKDTCMAFGFECGDGWYHLIESLCTEIDAEVKHTNELYPHLKFAVVAAQVKEKWGGLRFYVDFIYNHELLEDEDAMKKITSRIWEISGMIRIIESMSRNTCENCGGKCEREDAPFPRALCNACDQLRRDSIDSKDWT